MPARAVGSTAAGLPIVGRAQREQGREKGSWGEEEGLRGLVVIKAAEVIVPEQNHAASEPLQCGC